mgnify:CR=1 FL=1
MLICLNAVVGMCTEWHSDDGANTGSMSKGHAAPLSSPVLRDSGYKSATVGKRQDAFRPKPEADEVSEAKPQAAGEA